MCQTVAGQRVERKMRTKLHVEQHLGATGKS